MIGARRREVLAGFAAAALPRIASAQEREAVIEGAKKEGRMSLATSVSAASFARFMQAFAQSYPFLDVTSGYYSAPTGRVLARIDAELRGGALTFDALHVASLAPYLSYARAGRLLPYASPELAAYPAEAVAPDKTWATARLIGVIMAYNKNVLPPEQAPKAWADALRPEFKNRKLVLQDSAAGTAFAQIDALQRRLGDDFLKKLGAQKPMVVATSALVIDLLVRGEATLGFTVDHFRAFEPDAVKAGIVGVYPAEGMPVAPAPIAIFRDAPHPNAAKLFVDFVLSEQGQRMLALDIFGVYSARRGIPSPPGQMPLAETNPLLPKPNELAAYEAALAQFPELFEQLFR